jgi:hypothetical protein
MLVPVVPMPAPVPGPLMVLLVVLLLLLLQLLLLLLLLSMLLWLPLLSVMLLPTPQTPPPTIIPPALPSSARLLQAATAFNNGMPNDSPLRIELAKASAGYASPAACYVSRMAEGVAFLARMKAEAARG